MHALTPRSRENRMTRNLIEAPTVGDESMPLTCPRCGWPCETLTVIEGSVWAEHGGICEQCLIEWTRSPVAPPLPIADSGRDRRDAAIAQVGAAADREWKDVARQAVEQLAATGEPFTSDDVWRLLPDGVETDENRALGAVMMQASRSGLIVKTGRYVPSERPETHASPKAEWVGARDS